MRDDITKIVCSLIQNIGTVRDEFDMEVSGIMSKRMASGFDVLKDSWPNLTEIEKQELAAVALTILNIYPEKTTTCKKTR